MTRDWLDADVSYVVGLIGQHVVLAIVPVLAALVLSIPLGCLISRSGRFAGAVLAVFGVVRAIPALALFVAMPVFLGTQILDPLNVATALALYAVTVLVRCVVDGLRSVPEQVSRSAAALGYRRWDQLVLVELPLAMPAVFAGVRVVTVTAIAAVSVAAVIGTGALGQLFATGLSEARLTPVLVGLVLTVVLALLADGLILLIQRGTLPWRRAGRPA